MERTWHSCKDCMTWEEWESWWGCYKIPEHWRAFPVKQWRQQTENTAAIHQFQLHGSVVSVRQRAGGRVKQTSHLIKSDILHVVYSKQCPITRGPEIVDTLRRKTCCNVRRSASWEKIHIFQKDTNPKAQSYTGTAWPGAVGPSPESVAGLHSQGNLIKEISDEELRKGPLPVSQLFTLTQDFNRCQKEKNLLQVGFSVIGYISSWLRPSDKHFESSMTLSQASMLHMIFF